MEMKRKKKIEADKDTVYCPRTWCQGTARSSKYPQIPADLSTYDASESSSEDEGDGEDSMPRNESPLSDGEVEKEDLPPDPADRLAICEKCSLAFCVVCSMGWHGQFCSVCPTRSQ